MQKIIECVPNFSEGRNLDIINKIVTGINSIDEVSVIDIDPGKATNRTVVTIVGSPKAVCEAVFKGIKKATELIDMTKHHGEHPRFGATDVCPFVPVSGVSMEETIELARNLSKRIGQELKIPVYCYEKAAFEDKRKNLAQCRSGEYEALETRLSSKEWYPDFGPKEFNSWTKKTGAIAIGARNFLIAYNVNLNTTSTRRANAIAFDVREKGRNKRIGDPVTGKKALDENGKPIMIRGSLKSVKAIGWFIEEFGISQISMNLTDINVTSIHKAFEECCNKALVRGVKVTGSEIVGVVPLQAMLQAGKYYLRKQRRSTGIADKEIIKIAVKSMGLDELSTFDPDKKIIEYIIDKQNKEKKLVELTLKDFADETSSESPAPGGGSVSAYMGSLACALAAMVANLSSHKPGWDDKWEEFSDWAEQARQLQDKLIKVVDEDTASFNKIMIAFRMPQSNTEQQELRKQKIEEATKYAAAVPFNTMELCLLAMDICNAMVEIGNPNSITDAGVGALAAKGGVLGGFMNVCINAKDIKDKAYAEDLINRGKIIVEKADYFEKQITSKVNKVILT